MTDFIMLRSANEWCSELEILPWSFSNLSADPAHGLAEVEWDAPMTKHEFLVRIQSVTIVAKDATRLLLRTPEEWNKELVNEHGFKVIGWHGWNSNLRGLPDRDLSEPISKEEFEVRVAYCTIMGTKK